MGSCDFGFAFASADGQARARFRVAVFRQKGHIGMVLRKIPYKLLTFQQIGLPESVEELCRRPRGLFLVTGPTGSGKTTTLASMINYININFDRHIITVEDPLEYYHEHKKSIITQREVGGDVPTFAEALRRALRQDPDVVLVGEMRDLETISAAIRAAETGHLVFGTLHTTGASGTINRIIDAFPTDQQEQVRVQLSTTLLAVLSQALCPRIHGRDARDREPDPRKQDVPYRFDDPDRQKVRHAAARRPPARSLQRGQNRPRRSDRQVAPAGGTRRPHGCFPTDEPSGYRKRQRARTPGRQGIIPFLILFTPLLVNHD
jgi:type II secretory ATPase GspE/PulE/Tfp pilus assembly ATPase PilB-like protein